MKSMTLRVCTKFNLNPDEDTLPVSHKGESTGTIINADDTRTISNSIFHVFDCTFYKNFDEKIILDDGTVEDHFKKATNFRLYYSDKKQILLVPGPTNTTKTFLKDLADSYPERFDYKKFHFDFTQISQSNSLVKGIWFKVDDELIDSKAFFGDEVDQDDEASAALNSENGTYLITQLDIAGVERTIGFSQKSAIVVYNTIAPTDAMPLPYLQTIFDVYLTITNLS